MKGLALAVLLATSSAADAPRVAATASKTTLHVGETFTVDVSASGPAGTVFTFPKDAGGEAVEIRAAATSAGASPPPAGTQRYEAAAFALGETELPAIAVPYRLPDGTTGTATTQPVTLRVESVLPKDPEQQKLIDIRGPLSLTIGAPFWIVLAGMTLASAAGVWLWLRRQRPQAALPAEPPVSPYIEALAALDRLTASGLTERADYRAYYIALAEIAKRYLERRLDAHVLEMTSEEMAAFLRDHRAAAPFAGMMREIAGAADQIKFARAEGLADEARRHLDAARRMVRGLEERLRPAAETPATEGKVA